MSVYVENVRWINNDKLSALRIAYKNTYLNLSEWRNAKNAIARVHLLLNKSLIRVAGEIVFYQHGACVHNLHSQSPEERSPRSDKKPDKWNGILVYITLQLHSEDVAFVQSADLLQFIFCIIIYPCIKSYLKLHMSLLEVHGEFGVTAIHVQSVNSN